MKKPIHMEAILRTVLHWFREVQASILVPSCQERPEFPTKILVVELTILSPPSLLTIMSQEFLRMLLA